MPWDIDQVFQVLSHDICLTVLALIAGYRILFSPSFLCDQPCRPAIGSTGESLIFDGPDCASVLQYFAIAEGNDIALK